MKSQIVEKITSTATIGRSSGSVTSRKRWIAFAPSTAAACSVSFGIVCSPASSDSATNGNDCQTTVTKIATYALKRSANHA